MKLDQKPFWLIVNISENYRICRIGFTQDELWDIGDESGNSKAFYQYYGCRECKMKFVKRGSSVEVEMDDDQWRWKKFNVDNQAVWIITNGDDEPVSIGLHESVAWGAIGPLREILKQAGCREHRMIFRQRDPITSIEPEGI